MKKLASVVVALVATVTCSIALRADNPPDATYKQIKQQLGFVPTFVKAVPDEGVAAAWDEMSAIQMSSNTALPPKIKEMIGLAVAAQIPCRYCTYAHTQFAKAAGASDRELRESVAVSALTRHWSTVLNGINMDQAAFDKEMQQMFAYMQKGQPQGEAQPVTDAESAYKDIQRTFGAVPMFMRSFPQAAIAPAWREMKGVLLNPSTALSAKYKELIGLAVAAQIPCKYCVAFHTQASKMDGASDEEVKEAIAMAAMTRFWSTEINGTLQDETQFRREIDQMVKKMRTEARPPKAASRETP